MAIYLEIISGPNEGSKFLAKEGTKIGRSKGEIILNDPKVSGAHAVIEKDSKGSFFLTDLRSANGIVLSGQKVLKVALLPGVSFRLGGTIFKVNDEPIEEPIPTPKLLTWRDRLIDEMSKLKFAKTDPIQPIEIFRPILTLTILQGIQADQVIHLYYGPRNFGYDSLDVELMDKDVPKRAFVIVPERGGALLKSLAAGKVRLNNKIISEELLKDNDLISVGSTQIKVGYI